MAAGLPVVATDWGGPADYLDESCGILVPPTSRDSFIRGLAGGIRRLASSPQLRDEMGCACALVASHPSAGRRRSIGSSQIYRQVVEVGGGVASDVRGVDSARGDVRSYRQMEVV